MPNGIVQVQQQTMSMSDQIAFANSVSRGSLLPKDYRNNPANVVIAVGLGQSMGLSPAESLYRINVIQGKPTASAELIAAQVRKAGHKLRIEKDEKAMSVTATVVRCDDPDYPISVTRDKSWAKDMGLINKDNYRKQPLTMLTWRAITAVAREACPEALYGVAYTPDEMHDLDDDEPKRKAKAKPVKAKVEKPEAPKDDHLAPVRSRFKAWCAHHGLNPKDGVARLCEEVGAKDMQAMTEEQAKNAVILMDIDMNPPAQQEAQQAQAAQPAEGDEPEYYAEDVEF